MKAFQHAVLVVWLIASCPMVVAQSPPPAEKSETPVEKKQDGSPAKENNGRVNPYPIKPILDGRHAQHQAQPGYGRDATVDRRLAAFVRLRELMFEKVKLEADKRKKIDQMFDEYMAGLLNPDQAPHAQPRPEDAATPQELPELKKALAEAEKADDKEKIATLKAKIYAANIVLQPSVIDPPDFFFDYLRNEMNEAQQKEFEPVLNRWRMLRVAEVAPDNDFKHIRRAVRDPLLVDSEELGKQLNALIIEAIRTVPLGPKRLDKSVMAELAVATKPKVLEKLNPKQREHFEKTVEMLQRWEKEDPEIAQKTRDRLKNHATSRSADNPPKTPAQGSSNQP